MYVKWVFFFVFFFFFQAEDGIRDAQESRGLGGYDAVTGVETPRIQVTLATGIPEARCRRINLGYLDPAGIRVDEWAGREHEGVLLVPRAGEMLYRVGTGL